MSDSYQAIYDAVRSRISNGDIGAAIRDVAFQQFDLSYTKVVIQEQFCASAAEMARPSVLYRPALSADGDMWCALLGDDLMSGVAGFGKTPADAMIAFDQAFWNERTPAATRLINSGQIMQKFDAAIEAIKAAR